MIEQLEFSYEDPGPKEQSQPIRPNNEELAGALMEVATLLQIQGANRFRVEAYYRAANMLLALIKPAWQLYELEGLAGLEALPGIGRTISKALQQMIRGGRWPLLERLSGNDSIEQLFASVPNIGPTFAKRLHEKLGLETLAELQTAAWDGRLEKLEGMGEKRLRGTRIARRPRSLPVATPRRSGRAGCDQPDSCRRDPGCG